MPRTDPPELTLYTTLGCHLCEQAEELVRTVRPDARLHAVDIAEDDTLIAEYGERIPVLRRGERELGWPFGLLDVSALLADP
ncbi:MAG: glutaredoxin family protein [Alcanivorax sp.]|uniref:Glutaredoxin family protein n=1 Tax=Alloalcanivorax marinus TaxID=1177169 RepID=A0A9Q3ULW6_9GAMM|nr:glutaredoxin family protein [Alloalcanivorax marinus]MBM7334143.1 glutaredoxin family protein [Alloalcanivorax marinus]MCC4308630.1 glutaredoxin family protein [Alloalcanivorax marinus]